MILLLPLIRYLVRRWRSRGTQAGDQSAGIAASTAGAGDP
jgi:hypothetical protein